MSRWRDDILGLPWLDCGWDTDTERSHQSPERSFMAGMLSQAIQDHFSNNLDATERADLDKWFASTEIACDPDRRITYAFICQALGLDATWLRGQLYSGRIFMGPKTLRRYVA